MSVAPAGLDVVCLSCGGRSFVEPEHRSFPEWGCPFCRASNPLPDLEPHAPADPVVVRATAGGRWAWAAAALAVAGVVLAAVLAQSSIPRGDYRTVEGLAAALADRGMPCRDPRTEPARQPGVREAATCMMRSSAVRILTFASAAKCERYLTTHSVSGAVAGATWIVIPDDARLLPGIAAATGGRRIP